MSNNMCDARAVPSGPLLDANPTHIRGRQRAGSGCRAWAVGGVLVLVAVTGGCGGGGDARPANAAAGQVTPTTGTDTGQPSTSAPRTGSGAAASSCKLLTEGDATAAMRQPMKVSGDAGTICTYSATADPSVLLYVQTYASKAEATTNLQLEPMSEHIDGLGDDAFWNPTLDMVFVQNGDRSFAVTSPSLANLWATPKHRTR
jgi:hypothetical protein